MGALKFREATSKDIDEIVMLVNQAYRGEASRVGWTTEADLLDGLRIDGAELGRMFGGPDSLLLTCRDGAVLQASLHLQKVQAGRVRMASLGMFAVLPQSQGAGLGKRMLAEAEAQAIRRWDVRKMSLEVISLRTELIAYYERRGYQRTGKRFPFPSNPSLWVPRTDGLELVQMVKLLQSSSP